MHLERACYGMVTGRYVVLLLGVVGNEAVVAAGGHESRDECLSRAAELASSECPSPALVLAVDMDLQDVIGQWRAGGTIC